PMHRPSRQVTRAHHPPDPQITYGDDGVDLGSERRRATVERCEVTGDDGGGDHRDDGRGTPQRQRAGRASSHGGSFPGSSGARATTRRADRSGGRTGRCGGDYDDLALVVDDSVFFFFDDEEEDDESPFDELLEPFDELPE